MVQMMVLAAVLTGMIVVMAFRGGRSAMAPPPVRQLPAAAAAAESGGAGRRRAVGDRRSSAPQARPLLDDAPDAVDVEIDVPEMIQQLRSSMRAALNSEEPDIKKGGWYQAKLRELQDLHMQRSTQKKELAEMQGHLEHAFQQRQAQQVADWNFAIEAHTVTPLPDWVFEYDRVRHLRRPRGQPQPLPPAAAADAAESGGAGERRPSSRIVTRVATAAPTARDAGAEPARDRGAQPHRRAVAGTPDGSIRITAKPAKAPKRAATGSPKAPDPPADPVPEDATDFEIHEADMWNMTVVEMRLLHAHRAGKLPGTCRPRTACFGAPAGAPADDGLHVLRAHRASRAPAMGAAEAAGYRRRDAVGTTTSFRAGPATTTTTPAQEGRTNPEAAGAQCWAVVDAEPAEPPSAAPPISPPAVRLDTPSVIKREIMGNAGAGLSFPAPTPSVQRTSKHPGALPIARHTSRPQHQDPAYVAAQRKKIYCDVYTAGRHCVYGDRCRYRHEDPGALDAARLAALYDSDDDAPAPRRRPTPAPPAPPAEDAAPDRFQERAPTEEREQRHHDAEGGASVPPEKGDDDDVIEQAEEWNMPPAASEPTQPPTPPRAPVPCIGATGTDCDPVPDGAESNREDGIGNGDYDLGDELNFDSEDGQPRPLSASQMRDREEHLLREHESADADAARRVRDLEADVVQEPRLVGMPGPKHTNCGRFTDGTWESAPGEGNHTLTVREAHNELGAHERNHNARDFYGVKQRDNPSGGLGVRGRNTTDTASGAHGRNRIGTELDARGRTGAMSPRIAQGRSGCDSIAHTQEHTDPANKGSTHRSDGSVGDRGNRWRRAAASDPGAHERNYTGSDLSTQGRRDTHSLHDAPWCKDQDTTIDAHGYNGWRDTRGACQRNNPASDLGVRRRNNAALAPGAQGRNPHENLINFAVRRCNDTVRVFGAQGRNLHEYHDFPESNGSSAVWRKDRTYPRVKTSYLAHPHAMSAKARNRNMHILNGNQATRRSLRPSELKANIREIMEACGAPRAQTEFLYNKLHHETAPALLQSIAAQTTWVQRKAALRQASEAAGVRLEARQPAEQAHGAYNATRWEAAAAGRPGRRPADPGRGKGAPGKGKGRGKGQSGKGARKGDARDSAAPPPERGPEDFPQLFHGPECRWMAEEHRVDICQPDDLDALLGGAVAAVGMARARELYIELSGLAAEETSATALITVQQITPPGEDEPLEAELIEVPLLTPKTGALIVRQRYITNLGRHKVRLEWHPQQATGPAGQQSTRLIALISGDYAEKNLVDKIHAAAEAGNLEAALLGDAATAAIEEDGVFREWANRAGRIPQRQGTVGEVDGHEPKIFQLYRSPAAKGQQRATAFGNTTWTCSMEVDVLTASRLLAHSGFETPGIFCRIMNINHANSELATVGNNGRYHEAATFIHKAKTCACVTAGLWPSVNGVLRARGPTDAI
eukprot:gene215-3358_t